MNIKEQIAKDLLSIGAVFLRPRRSLHMGKRHQKPPFTAITD